MYVNGVKQSKTISAYMDFSGSNISIGQDVNGNSIEGNIDEVIMSSSNYTDQEITSMYTKGRGNATASLGSSQYTYSKDMLSKVSSNTTNYNFTYDSLGNKKTVAVGSSILITNNYDNLTGVLNNATYGNGNTVAYLYDNLNRVINKKLDGKDVATYNYDNIGNLAILNDIRSGVSYKYTYDLADRLVKTEDSKGNWYKSTIDETNKTSKKESYIGGNLYTTAFEFDKDGKTKKVVLPSGKSVSYVYDALGRSDTNTLNLANSKTFNVKYNYKNGYAGSGTATIASMSNNGSTINYTYDKLGRIETINNGKQIKYYYDDLGQVTREDNGELNKTVVYSYDKGGNILKVTEHPLTTGATLGTATKSVDYEYGDSNWKDKLTYYNKKEITYDTIGNPLTYDGYTYKWEAGRTLSSITGNSKTISYKYDSNGIRTGKTVNGVTSEYTLAGSSVVYEKIINGSSTDNIVYNYGDKGLVGFTLNGVEYFYERNAQNDIIGILDADGIEKVKYTYDTWGKLISITGDDVLLGQKNPYRYRGYRYDNETGLYYLQTRYYNPEIGRFINADGLVGKSGELLSHNLFSYCENNPIIKFDPNGTFPFAIPFIIEAIKVTVAAVVMVVAYYAIKEVVSSTAAVITGTYQKSDSRPEYTVYGLYNGTKIMYVGRTKNPVARKIAHGLAGDKKKLEFKPIGTNLTYQEARGLEQIEMIKAHTRMFLGEDGLNKINGIGVNNDNKKIYIDAAMSISGFLKNEVSNEVLNWLNL